VIGSGGQPWGPGCLRPSFAPFTSADQAIENVDAVSKGQLTPFLADLRGDGPDSPLMVWYLILRHPSPPSRSANFLRLHLSGAKKDSAELGLGASLEAEGISQWRGGGGRQLSSPQLFSQPQAPMPHRFPPVTELSVGVGPAQWATSKALVGVADVQLGQAIKAELHIAARPVEGGRGWSSGHFELYEIKFFYLLLSVVQVSSNTFRFFLLSHLGGGAPNEV